MSNDEWMGLFALFSAEHQSDLVLVLRNGSELAVEVFIRFEPKYIVIRGRVAGTDNEGRTFFVPFSELTCVRIEKPVKTSAILALYGETGTDAPTLPLAERSDPEPVPAPTPDAQSKRPTRSEEMRDKLLHRIRTTKSGGGPHSTDA